MWTWVDGTKRAVFRAEGDVHHSRSIEDAEIKEWLAAGNVPADAPQQSLKNPAAPSEPGRAQLLGSWTIGPLGVWLYNFARTGDKLLRHVHAFQHSSTLLTGRVRTVCDGEPDKILAKRWDKAAFEAGKYHELEALEDNSVVLQIMSDA